MRTRRLFATLTLAAACALPPAAAANTASGVRYLQAHRAASGCYAEPGGTPNVQLTGWVVLGLRAARANTAPGVACIARRVGTLTTVTDIELAIMALASTGQDPRSVGPTRRDLVAALRAKAEGSDYGFPAAQIFAVLALRAAGAEIGDAVTDRLVAYQQADGSYGIGVGSADSNLTAAAIQALRAAGFGPTAVPVTRARAALQRFRKPNGAYSLGRTGAADSQSTAWATQALAKVGVPTAAPRRFLAARQAASGAVSYRAGDRRTPVWVTAQALVAMTGRSWPL